MELREFCAVKAFTEGPVITRTQTLAFVAYRDGLVYLTDMSGSVTATIPTGGSPNGLTEGKDNVIYVAQAGAQPSAAVKRMTGGIQRIHPDGSVDYLTQDLVSPNDICFGPDGFLYVTDPTHTRSMNDGRIWKVDPDSGAAEILTSVPWYPNGIGFSTEDDALYVADSRHARIVRYALANGRLGHEEDFARMNHNRPDGFCFDVGGNLIVAAPDPQTAGDLQIFDRDGQFLETVSTGAQPYITNVALGADRRMFITSGDGILTIGDWPTAGLPLHPFRG
jgi:gluconolactonase